MKYTVQSGDTLSHIALRFLKDPNRWTEILENNAHIKGSNRINPGDVLEFFTDKELIQKAQDKVLHERKLRRNILTYLLNTHDFKIAWVDGKITENLFDDWGVVALLDESTNGIKFYLKEDVHGMGNVP